MLVRGLAWGKLVSSIFLYVIGFLGEFGLSPLEITLTLGELLNVHSMGRVGGWGHQRDLCQVSGRS